MFEKVNPSHPDKVADRIAGAIVDIAYAKENTPHIATEVLVGHNLGTVIVETDVNITESECIDVGKRIAEIDNWDIKITKQDSKLNSNQDGKIRCGDNGIFKGMPTSQEEELLAIFTRELYQQFPSDGKFILDKDKLVICQSNADTPSIEKFVREFKKEYGKYCVDFKPIINPLGEWTGGLDVDCGATNRKLGSDMGRAVTGGGLCGKDLSKADVSVNIYLHILAQNVERMTECSCAIGDETVNGKPFSEIVDIAKTYVDSVGGFEKLAEYGLIW